MGVSRSSLSHAVRGLETQLGVRLLNRTTRSVALTKAGERLLRRLTPMLCELDDMLDDVDGGTDEPAGTLRISANEAAVRWLLRHVVPDVLAKHPRIALDLVAEGRLVDIVADGFDAGVRLREAVPQDMIAVPFAGDVRFLAVASPRYVAVHGAPIVPDDLHRHHCIRQRLPSGKPYRWEFARGADEITIDVPGALTLDHSGLMVDAAIDGLGVAFVPESVAQPALDAGSLQILIEEWSPTLPGLCLYYPGHRHVPPALRAFIDLLRWVSQTSDVRRRP